MQNSPFSLILIKNFFVVFELVANLENTAIAGGAQGRAPVRASDVMSLLRTCFFLLLFLCAKEKVNSNITILNS